MSATLSVPLGATRNRVLAAGLASVVAWSFDLFDLFLILYMAPTIGPLFFPSQNPMLSLAAVYASFAVTLLMRPVGSAIFGSYADRNGRKRAMIVSVVGVGVATAALGALPTLAQAGVIAPVLFLIVRLVQGVFVGGVVASTHTLGTETIAPKWRGMLSGLIGGGGAGIGAFLASAAFFGASYLFPGDAFAVWGWRVMFFTGLIGALISLFIFRSVEESPMWQDQDARKATAQAPLKVVFSQRYLPIFIVNLLIVIGASTMYYLTSGFLPTFLAKVNGLPKGTSGTILMLAAVFVIIGSTLAGHVSELIGRKKAFVAFGIINLVALPLLYTQQTHAGADAGLAALYTCALAFFGSIGFAPVIAFLNERFPTAIRSTGTSLSWNCGFALGGMMPTWVSLASKTPAALPQTLEIFLAGAALLMLVGTIFAPETKGRFE
ncbi:MAG: transporter, family, proline/betaine transporter [Candidatus Eremiobacteraeota bacterium]|nr:transporter, family, proline/betaine transporter [Candidatus Eremiobacteraeota bacterium]